MGSNTNLSFLQQGEEGVGKPVVHHGRLQGGQPEPGPGHKG